MNLAPDEPARILAHGIDTLHLALDVRWSSPFHFFEYLDGLRAKATDNMLAAGQSPTWTGSDDYWRFNVRPHGTKGYQWMLESNTIAMQIALATEPGPKPGILVQLRSEFLWGRGVNGAIAFLRRHLELAGAEVVSLKPSRVDLCVDVLLRESDWGPHIQPLLVKRSRKVDLHWSGKQLTGYTIGRGDIMARLYDKPAEIRQKSDKTWMFDVWGLADVPAGHRIIRVEFQIRREKLVRLKLRTLDDLMAQQGRLWHYCASQWLKLQDRPGLHHTQRHTVPWWGVVQNGYPGAQGSTPMVSDTAKHADRVQLARQCFGQLASLIALDDGPDRIARGGIVSIVEALPQLYRMAHQIGLSDEAFTEKVHGRIADYGRSKIPPALVADETVS